MLSTDCEYGNYEEDVMKTIIASKDAPNAIGPYAQAISVGNIVYTSGQLGINPATGKLEEGIEAQTHMSLKNLQASRAEKGMTLDDVVKTTVFVKNLDDFTVVNQIYGNYFTEYPARSCVQVAKLPMDGLVEIECIACR